MEEEKEIMLKVDHVSKAYKLGEIGGTTLRDEFQRLKAKLFKKEDPTKKIGAKDYNKGEKFKALDDISFEVRKGERIGIIGHNGAGKSTLLKLISRVTGPTEGNIYLNGRVASMLEVGTGFHPELTGRENIYMNGAILGMTKKEIDAKIEDIIEFSEVRQFIDTPVKRYSSGMYVKLAFSVAAHLDSEIMIMDEVLAVGDMAFQNKCITKMRSVSEEEDRTILYVSHNMNTIRQLCNRVIVLNKGHIEFDGDVESGINQYMNYEETPLGTCVDLSNRDRGSHINRNALLEYIDFPNANICSFKNDSKMVFSIKWKLSVPIVDHLAIRFTICDASMNSISGILCDVGSAKIGSYVSTIELDLSNYVFGYYHVNVDIVSFDNHNNEIYLDAVGNAFSFEIQKEHGDNWNIAWWGRIKNTPFSISTKKVL